MRAFYKKQYLYGLLVALILGSISAGYLAADSSYVVQPGDTLTGIAIRYGTTVNALAQANNILNPNFIYVGQVLTIPGDDSGGGGGNPTPTPVSNGGGGGGGTEDTIYYVQPGDTLYQIAARFGVTVQAIAQRNGILNINFIYVGQALTIPGTGGGGNGGGGGGAWTPTPAPTADNGGGGGGAWTPTPQATATAAPPQPTATPVPTSAPSGNLAFELGGQTHSFANPGVMKQAGMNWVKFQHKWGNGDSPDAVRGRIDSAHSQGFKVLLSIPGADHSSIDFNAYTDFLAGVAALGPDAIEVWNEGNIDREWPAGQISATSYTNNMLKPAYQKIKAVNPNVMVISGAPAPTGFFGGCTGAGCDDNFYMQEMANAGAANYMDCIGIHYNEGIISPTQTSGDPRGNSSHYSRYFWGMTNTYWNAFGGSKPLCYTEIGYLTSEGYGSLPGGFAWAADTSLAEHAQWLGEAASLSKSSGKIRMMIVFNVDFTLYGEDPQAGFGIIRPGGACPACGTLGSVMGQ